MVVGHIGRFSKQKNHKFLIEVFAQIKKSRPDAKLLLVGKGDLQDAVFAQVKAYGLTEDVIFAGTRSDIPAVLSAMDVFVFPSFHEGMPNAVIEAQATALPCVIADTITHTADITGLITYLPLGDGAVWADKTLEAVSVERKDTKQAFVDNKYDIETSVNCFVKLVFGE